MVVLVALAWSPATESATRLTEFATSLGAHVASRRVDFKSVLPCADAVMDALMAFPSIILAIVLMGILGPSINNIILALTIVFVPRIARIARSSVLVVREEVYVEAARSTGASDKRLMFRHVLPNILSPLITQASYTFALAVFVSLMTRVIGSVLR